jgi:hypothetical protein
MFALAKYFYYYHKAEKSSYVILFFSGLLRVAFPALRTGEILCVLPVLEEAYRVQLGAVLGRLHLTRAEKL